MTLKNDQEVEFNPLKENVMKIRKPSDEIFQKLYMSLNRKLVVNTYIFSPTDNKKVPNIGEKSPMYIQIFIIIKNKTCPQIQYIESQLMERFLNIFITAVLDHIQPNIRHLLSLIEQIDNEEKIDYLIEQLTVSIINLIDENKKAKYKLFSAIGTSQINTKYTEKLFRELVCFESSFQFLFVVKNESAMGKEMIDLTCVSLVNNLVKEYFNLSD